VKREINIQAGPVNAKAELNGTETATAIWNALPIQARVRFPGLAIFPTVMAFKPGGRWSPKALDPA